MVLFIQVIEVSKYGGSSIAVENFIYKDECLYICLYLIQIHISEPMENKLCTHLPSGLEETVGYVWAHNISLSHLCGLFCRERVQIPAQEMAARATIPCYCVISVMHHVLV